MATAAERRMMGLMQEVDTDEDWLRAVLTRPALTLVDVYPEWAGPCLAMRTQLIRFKLTEGGDDLSLFSANASTISFLSRFREFSEPTWMFLGSGKLVHLHIGCSRPQIINLLRKELAKERGVLRGEGRRKVLPMKKMTVAEKARQEAVAARQRKLTEKEEARAAEALRAVRLRAYSKLAEALPNHTVVLFLPHSLQRGELPEVAEALQATWHEMGVYVVSSASLVVSPEAADEVFWERRLPQHAELVESLKAGQSLALLLRRGSAPRVAAVSSGAPPSPTEDGGQDLGGQGDAPAVSAQSEVNVEDDDDPMRPGLLERLVAETVYGFFPGSASTSSTHNDSLSEFFSPVGVATPPPAPALAPDMFMTSPSTTSLKEQFRLSAATWLHGYGSGTRTDLGLGPEPEDDAEEFPGWDAHDLAEYEGCSLSVGNPSDYVWPKELRPVVDSVAAALLRRCSNRSGSGSLVLPGVWTPLTPLSKAAAVRVLFSSFAQLYYEPEEVPPPPPKATVVCFSAPGRYKVLEVASNLLSEVYHMGFYTEDRQLLAETAEQYDSLLKKDPRDRLAMAVGGNLLLELSGLHPVYISPNQRIADQDVEEFFTGEVRRAPVRLTVASYASIGSTGSAGEGDVRGPSLRDVALQLQQAAPAAQLDAQPAAVSTEQDQQGQQERQEQQQQQQQEEEMVTRPPPRAGPQPPSRPPPREGPPPQPPRRPAEVHPADKHSGVPSASSASSVAAAAPHPRPSMGSGKTARSSISETTVRHSGSGSMPSRPPSRALGSTMMVSGSGSRPIIPVKRTSASTPAMRPPSQLQVMRGDSVRDASAPLDRSSPLRGTSPAVSLLVRTMSAVSVAATDRTVVERPRPSVMAAGRVAAGSVAAGSVAAGSVAAGSVAAGSVAAGSVAAGSVAVGSVAAGSVAAGSVAAGSVTAGSVAAGSVATGSVAAGSVAAGSVADSAVPPRGSRASSGAPPGPGVSASPQAAAASSAALPGGTQPTEARDSESVYDSARSVVTDTSTLKASKKSSGLSLLLELGKR